MEKDILHNIFSLAGVFQNSQGHGVHQAPITVEEVGHGVVVAGVHSLEKLLVFPPTEAGGIGDRGAALGDANTQGRIVRDFIHQRVGMGRRRGRVAVRDLAETAAILANGAEVNNGGSEVSCQTCTVLLPSMPFMRGTLRCRLE